MNCLHCLEYYPYDDHATSADGEIVIRAGIPIDIERMAECRNFPERLPERFATREHCVVGMTGEKVIGYQWFCDKSSSVEERYGYRVEIPSDAVYGYDAFVLSSYRRLGVWTRFHAQYLQSLLAKLGRKRVIVMVDQNNGASMKAHLHLGYTLYRKVYIFMVFGRCFWVMRTIDGNERKFWHALPPKSSGADPKQMTSFVS